MVLIDNRDMVWADIPGLIEGAHEGAGLGIKFLRHIERTRLIVHLLDGMSPDPLGDYAVINQELEQFNPLLAEKPQVVVLNKMDLTEVHERWPDVAAGLQEARRARADRRFRRFPAKACRRCCAASPTCWPNCRPRRASRTCSRSSRRPAKRT